MEAIETSGETTSLLQSRNSGRDTGPMSKRALKYESIKLPPPDAHVPRFYIGKGHIWLTLIIGTFVTVFAAVSITSGLPLLETKWQAYNEEQS